MNLRQFKMKLDFCNTITKMKNIISNTIKSKIDKNLWNNPCHVKSNIKRKKKNRKSIAFNIDKVKKLRNDLSHV